MVRLELIHALYLLAGLTGFLWYKFIFQVEPRSLRRLLLFPVSHAHQVWDMRKYPSAFPIGLAYIYIITFIISILYYEDRYVYTFCWGLILIYELFGLVSYIFGSEKQLFKIITLILIVFFVSYGMLSCLILRNYDYMTNIDFIESILLFACSLFVVIWIIVKDLFAKNIDAFFVFFGLVIYSFLHILSNVPAVIDFMKLYYFAGIGEFITYVLCRFP